MNENNITWLVGETFPEYCVFEPYADVIVDFLNDLSQALLHRAEAKKYPDIISFAYFCRKANILKKKQEFAEPRARLGRGIIFHIAPSNVPVNFAFSYVFGLLAGNGNVVRVPSKEFPHTKIICDAINAVLLDAKFKDIKASTAFVKYGHDDEITEYFSVHAHGRIIWGGDAAIAHIRKFPLPPRGVDVAFSDRYSIAAIDANAILAVNDKEMERLANAFYNDTYLMDQNACSSPQLIFWEGTACADAQKKFWSAVQKCAENKYNLQPVSAVDKFTKLCCEAIDNAYVKKVTRYGNILYVADLEKLPENADELRGTCGYFYQYTCYSLNEVIPVVNEKYQTLVYYGLSADELSSVIVKNHARGIDRVVPVGQALDIDVIWDGYDLVRTLSRIVDVR